MQKINVICPLSSICLFRRVGNVHLDNVGSYSFVSSLPRFPFPRYCCSLIDIFFFFFSTFFLLCGASSSLPLHPNVLIARAFLTRLFHLFRQKNSPPAIDIVCCIQ